MDQQMPNQTPMEQGDAKQPAVSKWLWITLIVVVVLAAAYFVWYYAMGPGKKTETTTNTETTTEVDETADWQTYTNKTYGFTLTFGDIWKGYTVKEAATPGELTTAGIAFHLKTTDKNWISQQKTDDTIPFGIQVYTLSQWNNGKLEGEVPIYIAKNDQYVFTYMIIQDQTISDMQAINADVKNVISTFKFTTAASTTSATADWKTYTNSDYGFNLTLTDVWKEYSVYLETPSNGNAIKYIRFLLPTTDKAFGDDSAQFYGKSGVVSPFTIAVYTISGYAKEQADAVKDGSPTTKSIGQNNKYVFTWASWQDSPSDLRNKDLGFDLIKTSLKTQDVN